MKIKKKSNIKGIPSSGSLCGFSHEDWLALNSGKSVEVEKIPAMAEGLVEKVESKTKAGGK